MSAKKTILLVEDDDDGRQAICTMLESFGYQFKAFASGIEALAELKAAESRGERVHLALLDIMLPGMNGYEILAELREMPHYVDLPVIMVTAKDADNEIIEGYKYGADYYITKPFTASQLKYGVQLYLGELKE